MENKEMVKQLAKLQTLLGKYLKKNTNIKFITYGDYNKLLGGNKTSTYRKAIKRLNQQAIKLCKNKKILNDIAELEKEIEQSKIADYRFGLATNLTNEEEELDDIFTKNQIFYSTGTTGIKDAAELTGITEAAIKQACQQERLLCTEKLGKNWVVNIHEINSLWGLEEKGLFKEIGWKY